MNYRVRQGFVLHLGDRPPIPGGAIVYLTASEFERHAHQLEPVGEAEALTIPENLPEFEAEEIKEPPAELPAEPTPEPAAEPKRRATKKEVTES